MPNCSFVLAARRSLDAGEVFGRTVLCVLCGRRYTMDEGIAIRQLAARCGDEAVFVGTLPPQQLGVSDVACIHRGEKKGRVKCQCGGGRESWLDAYVCDSPREPRRRCVIRVRGKLQEEEASLYAVCAGCRVREPPAAGHTD